MHYFKDLANGIHELDSVAFLHLLPSGCVEITKSEADALRAPSLETVIALAWGRIKSERDRRQFNGGVLVDGNWFLSTERAVGEYNSLLNVSQNLPTDTVLRAGWRTMDGAEVDMTPDLARQILAAGVAQRCAIDDAALAHKSAMEASESPSEYDFSSGWPTAFWEDEA